MNKNALFTFLFAFVVIMGCSKTIDRAMLVGEYTANHKKAIDTLKLRSDGTYVHYYKTAAGEEFTNINRWEFEYVDGKPYITFLKFIFRLPGYGTPKAGFWVVEVEKSLFGNLGLCIDPDLNYYYIKQN